MEKITVGIYECYVIEKKTRGSSTYILGKRTRCPFPDLPYLTIYRDDDNGGLYQGHYDMNLKDALEDFEKRTRANESFPFVEDLMHPDDTRFAQGEMDDLERMEYEYNLIEWEKQHSY
jgi:hypothetical protein